MNNKSLPAPLAIGEAAQGSHCVVVALQQDLRP